MKLTFIILSFFLISTTMTAQQSISTTQPTISVKGEGVVNVVPDKAMITVRVEEEGTTAQEVKAKTDKAIDNVIKFLRSMKLDDKDFKSDYVSLNKNYDYNKKVYNYKSNQTISIKLDNLDVYEPLMSGLIQSGINRIDGVNFGSSNSKVLQVEARKNAIKDAKSKAEDYVSVLNQTVGKALTISETGANSPQPKMRMMAMEASYDNGGAPQETLAKGEMQIKVEVNVTFELK